MVEGFHHAGVAVADLPRALTFYEEVLGCEPVRADDPEATPATADYYWVRVADDQWINLAHRPDATPAGRGPDDDPHLAFRVDEAGRRRVKRRVERRGRSVRETATSLYFYDPDDNYLEVTHFAGP